MAMNYEAMVSYFNYGIIAMLVLAVIFGFFKGIFKSVYNLIVFVALILIGWLLSPLFANVLLNQDISSFGFEFDGVQVTTLGSFLTEYLSNMEGIGSAIAEGSLLLETINAFVLMIAKIIVLIVWLILMATVFKLIFWIIYLIIKPKKDKEGNKRKKTLGSRLGGMGISLGHALLVVLMISVPLAGITSIGASLTTLIPEGDPTELSYDNDEFNVVFTSNGLLLATEDENLEDAIKFMENYRETLAGKIGGFIKFGDTHFDEGIFDTILSMKVDGNRIKFRQELSVAVKVYGILMEELDGEELNLDTILKIDRDVLDGVVEDLSKLKLVHVAVPIGLEIAVNGDMFDEELGDLTELVDLEELLVELKKIDYEKEIGNLGSSFVAAMILIAENTPEDTDEEFNFLAMDPVKVNEVATSLSESEIIKILNDVAIQYLINTEDVATFLSENGRTIDDIDLDGVSLNTELLTLGSIYTAFVNAGFTSLDFNTLDLNTITDENLNEIGEAVYSSKLFSNNSMILADILFESLPDDYKTVFVINNFNKQDFVSVLALGVIMANSGMLDDEGADPLNILTEENIEKIAEYISSSDLLTDNVEGLLTLLLEGASLPIEIEFPEEFNWKGEAGKTELIALFTTAEKIVGMMDSGEGFNFTKENIDVLSETMVESEILMFNVDNLLNYMIAEADVTLDFEIRTFEEEKIDWTTEDGETEFKALLNAIGVVLDQGASVSIDAITSFTDEEIDTLVASKVLVYNIVGILNDYTKPADDTPAGSLHGTLYMPEDNINYYGSDGELKKFILAAKLIIAENTNPGEGFEDISSISLTSITGANQNVILASEIMTETIINTIENLRNDSSSFITLPDDLNPDHPDYNKALWRGEDGELVKALDALSALGLVDYNDNIDFTPLYAEARGDVEEVILASRVVEATIINKIEVEASTGALVGKLIVPTDVVWEKTETDKGELRKLLVAVEILLDGASFETAEFKVEKLFNTVEDPNRQDTLLESRVVEASIINTIETEATTGSLVGKLIIPIDVVWEQTIVDNVVTDKGELRKLLVAIEILLDGNDFETAEFKVEKLFNTVEDPNRQDTLLESRVIEASIVNTIEIEMAVGGSLHEKLVKPTSFDESDWYGTTGELRRFLASIEVIIGPNELGTATFDVDTILGPDQETILASVVVEASVIKYVTEDSKLTIPEPANISTYYYFDDELIVWEKTETDEGELRRFLRGVNALLGGGTFSTFVFSMDNLLTTDFTDVMPSRVLEATIGKTINDLVTTGALDGFIKQPVDNYQWYHHATSTNTVRNGGYVLTPTRDQYSDLLGFIESIQMMDTAGLNFNALTFANVNATDSTDLSDALWNYSRVMRGSIETMLNKILDDAVVPYQFPEGTFTSQMDVKNGLDLMKVLI